MDASPLTQMEELLVMAAAVRGLGPNTRLTANANKVVGQALQWAGQMDEEVQEAVQNLEDHPAIKRCYAVLIRMIRQMLQNGLQKPPERPGDALFEGAGNFGSPGAPPAFPHFTSCRLTEYGESVARDLLRHHPEYRVSF
jgi:hypothetical protein